MMKILNIKFELDSDIANKIKDKNYIINILAEEKEKYNIVMSYDILDQEKENGEREGKSGSSVGLVLLWIFIILLIAVGAYLDITILLEKNIKKMMNLSKK